ncbi:glycoside-pentoside-hexuronide (GPH):cation symporter [Lachnospiraceae bacterium 29-91]
MGNNTSTNSGRLSVWRRAAYGFTDAGGNFAFSMVSSYLTVFYTDVVGLTPAVISVIMLIARIWDGVNDPMMGIICEKTQSRWGRYRPYLLFGAPVLGLCTVLAFTRPGWTGPTQALYCGITYILAGMAYTVTGVASQALANVITRDNQERMILISFRGAISSIATLITSAATMPMILKFGGGNASSSEGYLWTVIIYAILGTICYWIAFAGSKEVITVDPGESIPIGKSLKIAFGDANIRKLLIGFLLYMCGVFGRVGIMVYFFLYVVEQPMWLSIAGTVMTIAMAAPNFVAPFLTKRFEKKSIILASLILGAIGGIIIFLGGMMMNLLLILAGTAMFHGCGAAAGTVSFGLIAEIIDDMEVRTGQRADAIVLSVTSFSVKLGNAIAGSLGVVLLGAVGYVANEVQDASTKFAMSGVINLMPAALFLAALIPFVMIAMNKAKATENQKILQERHANKEQ